jgi:hypothetical protein
LRGKKLARRTLAAAALVAPQLVQLVHSLTAASAGFRQRSSALFGENRGYQDSTIFVWVVVIFLRPVFFRHVAVNQPSIYSQVTTLL